MHIRGIHSFPEFVLRVNKCEEGCPRVAVRRWEQRMPPSPVLKKVSLGQKPLPAEGTGAQRQQPHRLRPKQPRGSYTPGTTGLPTQALEPRDVVNI